MPEVTYFESSDMVSVFYQDGPDANAVFLDDGRVIEISSTGEVVGLDFEDASNGVRLSGLPIDPSTLAPLLEAQGVHVLDYAAPTVAFSAPISYMPMPTFGAPNTVTKPNPVPAETAA